MGSVTDMQKLLKQKDDRITELERRLVEKEAELEVTMSKLHEYQSIVVATAGVGIIASGGPRKHRALGVSAPQTTKTMLELGKETFKAHSKSPRLEISNLSV